MWDPTPVTWALIIFGWVLIFAPVAYAQALAVTNLEGRRTKDLLIAPGEEWRDRTHMRGAYGIAVADLAVWLPLQVAASVGVILGEAWGYLLWAAAAAISVYISSVLWFLEREYVYPRAGALRYYTYYWGFFVYWGAAVVGYCVLRPAGTGL